MPSRKLLPRVSQTWLVVTAMTLLAYWSRSSFGMGVLLFLAAWLLFMLNEGSYFHSAQEHENRFTLCMGVYAARVAFFTADSPLAFVGRHSPTLGYFLMGAIGYWFCQWNRVAHRQQLTRPVFISGLQRSYSQSTFRRNVDLTLVRSVVAEVIRHVKGLDHFWVPNTPGPVRWLIPFLLEKVGLSRLLVPGWSVNEMDAVVHALDRCNGHELNEVISRLSHYRARRGSNSGDGNEAAAAATAAATARLLFNLRRC